MQQGPADHAELGSWNVYCDRCRRKYKNYDLRKEWTGLMVCERCWDPRHPQDFIKPAKEDIAPEYARPTRGEIDGGPTYTSAGVQESSIPTGTFTSNNNTL